MTCPFRHQTGVHICLTKGDHLDHASCVYLMALSLVLVGEGASLVGGLDWDSESNQSRSSQMPHPPLSCSIDLHFLHRSTVNLNHTLSPQFIQNVAF